MHFPWKSHSFELSYMNSQCTIQMTQGVCSPNIWQFRICPLRWPWFPSRETDMTQESGPWNSLPQTAAAGNEVVFLFLFLLTFLLKSESDGLSVSFLKTLPVFAAFFGSLSVQKTTQSARSAGLWATFSESAAVSWISRWDGRKRKTWDESIGCIPSKSQTFGVHAIWLRTLDESSWIILFFWKIYFLYQYIMRSRAKFDCWELNINIPNLSIGTDVSEGIQRLPYPMICFQFAGCFWKNPMSVFGTVIPTARSLLLM